MKILAIETSHDDTSIALYSDFKIIKEKTVSQTKFHKKFGGTIPEYAARNHEKTILKVFEEVIENQDLSTIDHIAFTQKPGLIGSLHVGSVFAKALGIAIDKEVIPINHLHGHILASAFENEIIYPAIALVVSGGHTQIWKLKSAMPNDMVVLGDTQDDAIGEVFDKIGRKLEIGFPGGPAIDKKAKKAKNPIVFKIGVNDSWNFSFSGLKTKVINYINKNIKLKKELEIENICKGFQNAVFYPVIEKMKRAILMYNPNSIILGGGVSANSQLREEFRKLHHNVLIPNLKYTTDNAAMIAIASDLQNKN